MLLVTYLPGAMFNPPMIFAYVAHTLYTRRKRKIANAAIAKDKMDDTSTEA